MMGIRVNKVRFLFDSVNLVKSPANCVTAVCGFLCNFAPRIKKQKDYDNEDIQVFDGYCRTADGNGMHRKSLP